MKLESSGSFAILASQANNIIPRDVSPCFLHRFSYFLGLLYISIYSLPFSSNREDMLKTIARKPWICSRCVRNVTSKRFNSTVAPSAIPHETYQNGAPLTNARHVPPATKHDDRTLRLIFDSPGFWKEFSQSSKSGKKIGLVQNRYLIEPRGFKKFAEATLTKAKAIVQRVLSASTHEEYARIPKDLDRLSDLLCRVIDLSDFVRATHPDGRMQDAADTSFSMMYEYMNVLNTTTGLEEQLRKAIQLSKESNEWSVQERLVADKLQKDFAKSAIDLPAADRQRFVDLSNDIAEVGPHFTEYMSPAKTHLTFPSSKLKGMNPILVREHTRWGQVTLPTIGAPAITALRSVQDEDVRKEVFLASRTSHSGNIMRLEEMLRKRAQLAKLSKYSSYGHMFLEDKMARSPESVNGFLGALLGDNRAEVESIYSELLQAKMADHTAKSSELNAWDKDYYTSRILSRVRSKTRAPDSLSSFFSLGRVMQGLSRLFTQLYGVRFVPHETAPGETWNNDVRRIDVISDTEGHVAVLYMDLFQRVGKSPNPAHFTLRCSRLIRHNELEEISHAPSPLFSSAEEAANDGMSFSSTSEGIMQLPTIAIICDYEHEPSSAALLSFSEVTTLFHEMGHAIHSILGRTAFQEVSGTRCATDFAELPSVLMEHFAADPSVLSLFAAHHETEQPLPYELVAEKLALDKRFEAADIENQILLSMLDQALHSSLPFSPDFSSTKTYHYIQNQFGVLPGDPPSTSWQGFFGHLFGYGAVYYSYLFDRVLARRVWDKVFQSGTEGGGVNRANGERMKESLLKHGGAKADVLGDERVRSGGNEAMQLVGSWGIEGRRGGIAKPKL
jgi:intermediate peptidase